MKYSMDNADQFFEGNPLLSPKDEFSPTQRQEQSATSAKKQGKPLSTRKMALLSGLVLVTIFGLGLRLSILRIAPGHTDWTFKTQGAIAAAPTVVNNTVYVCTDPGYPDFPGAPSWGTLYALDTTSGKVRWSFWTMGTSSSSPVVVNGIIYVSTSNATSTPSGGSSGMLYALNAASGKAIWSVPIESAIDSLLTAVNGGVVYAITQDGSLVALDALSGSKKWSFPIKGSVLSSPTAANGTVYVGDYEGEFLSPGMKGTLYALDAVSGKQKWSYSAKGGMLFVSPTVANGFVYAAFGNGTLYALDETSGVMKWSYPTGGGIFFVSSTVSNSLIYVVDSILGNYGMLYALDARSGVPKWTRQATVGNNSNGMADWAPPIVINGVIYTSSNADSLDDNMYAFDTISGKQKWSDPMVGPSSGLTTVANGTVYAASVNGLLYAFDAVSGKQKWLTPLGGFIQSAPTIADGIAYIGTNDGTLYALFT